MVLGLIKIHPFDETQCNPNSYGYRLSPFLKKLDFDEIRTKRLQRRSDLSEGVSSIDAAGQISELIIIENNGSFSELKVKIEEAMVGNLTNGDILGGRDGTSDSDSVS